MFAHEQDDFNANNFLNKGQKSQKQIFKKLQKILISIEIKHFLFILYYSNSLHVIYFFKTYFEI